MCSRSFSFDLVVCNCHLMKEANQDAFESQIKTCKEHWFASTQAMSHPCSELAVHSSWQTCKPKVVSLKQTCPHKINLKVSQFCCSQCICFPSPHFRTLGHVFAWLFREHPMHLILCHQSHAKLTACALTQSTHQHQIDLVKINCCWMSWLHSTSASMCSVATQGQDGGAGDLRYKDFFENLSLHHKHLQDCVEFAPEGGGGHPWQSVFLSHSSVIHFIPTTLTQRQAALKQLFVWKCTNLNEIQEDEQFLAAASCKASWAMLVETAVEAHTSQTDNRRQLQSWSVKSVVLCSVVAVACKPALVWCMLQVGVHISWPQTGFVSWRRHWLNEFVIVDSNWHLSCHQHEQMQWCISKRDDVGIVRSVAHNAKRALETEHSSRLPPKFRGEFQNALQTLLQLRGEFQNSPLI